jgi:hypothetical protein
MCCDVLERARWCWPWLVNLIACGSQGVLIGDFLRLSPGLLPVDPGFLVEGLKHEMEALRCGIATACEAGSMKMKRSGQDDALW